MREKISVDIGDLGAETRHGAVGLLKKATESVAQSMVLVLEGNERRKERKPKKEKRAGRKNS